MASSEVEHSEYLKSVSSRRASLKEKLAELFPEPARLTLEVGCGHGHWLVGYGAKNSAKQCIGVDLIGNRIDRANKKADTAGLANVRFLKAEAMEALDLLPEHIDLEEVFVLFSDPWPKKRHWKNRLFSNCFLEELGSKSDRGVRCHFRTDHVAYFEWVLEVVDNQSVWKIDSEAEWPFELETVFQARSESYQSLILVNQK